MGDLTTALEDFKAAVSAANNDPMQTHRGFLRDALFDFGRYGEAIDGEDVL
jgi:hypothetical protein